MATRSESFLSDQQARDTVTDVELAIDEKGKFLALRVKHIASMGAFVGVPGAHIQTNNFSRCFPGMYAIPRIQVDVRCVFTNTVPTGPYRGGRTAGGNYGRWSGWWMRRRASRHRPDPAAAAQSHPRRAIPYKTRSARLRLRRFRADPREGARALSLHGFQETPREFPEAQEMARDRGFPVSSNMRAGCRPKARRCVSRRRQAGARHRRAEHRTRACHDLSRLIAAKLGIPAAQIVHRHGDTNLDLKGNRRSARAPP